MIRMTTDAIDPDVLRRELFDPAAGGLTFAVTLIDGLSSSL